MDDFQQAAFKAGFDIAKDFCESAAQATMTKIRANTKKVATNLGIGFDKYLTAHIDRFSNIKTLVNRHVPKPFLEIYVDAKLRMGDREYEESSLLAFALHKRLLIVTGMAGCGKSMLMRRTFLRLLQNGRGYIPLFIALRNNKSGATLKDYLFSALSEPVSSLTREQFDYGLSIGKFAILLDGLDEVSPTQRPTISQEIIDLSNTYTKLLIVCTSRPNESFIAWDKFTVATVKPFDQDQALELVVKSPYEDEDAKSKFSDLLSQSLYLSHTVFLSNPLLCMMMLLTYDEHKEIPENMHTFYSLAYDVLYGSHDKSKGHGYKREFHTCIAPDNFRKVFCTFSTMLYADNKIALSNDEANSYARKALKVHDLLDDPSDYIEDLVECVSILIRDGLYLHYIHRSFQEYFVAVYINERYGDNLYRLADYSVTRDDEVVPLLFAMNRDALEQKYLKEKLLELISIIEHIRIDVNPSAVFDLFYIGFRASDDSESGADLYVSSGQKRGPFSIFLEKIVIGLYGMECGWPLEAFDWISWRAKYSEYATDEEGTEYDASVDILLLSTPFLKMLHNILHDLKTLLNNIKNRESISNKLFPNLEP